MSYRLSLLGMGFRNEDEGKGDKKREEEWEVLRLHWEAMEFKIDLVGLKRHFFYEGEDEDGDE